MFLSAPSERSGAAGGMQGTARLVGQTVGAIIMTLLFPLTSAESAPQIGLGIGSALTLVASIVSVLQVKPATSDGTISQGSAMRATLVFGTEPLGF